MTATVPTIADKLSEWIQAMIRIEHFPDDDVVQIEGIKYACVIFRALGLAPVGTLMRIEKRDDDGVLTIKTYPAGEQVIA